VCWAGRPQTEQRGVGSRGLDAPVRLAAVEEVADAVDRVLEERGNEENDDARGRGDAGNRVERGDKTRCFRDVGKNQ
jgi:hypothetical protein